MFTSHNLGPLARAILKKRGITGDEQIAAFLDPANYVPTPPDELPGLTGTAEMLLASVRAREKICVYGDYDVDGMTSTAILVSLLRSLGASITFHVPDRFKEGYGMNESVVRRLAEEGIQTILTCDCGIANIAEIALAKELGLRVLVTDHHLLPLELPPADAIVNPQLLPQGHRARNLSGAGVAYMLAKRVLQAVNRGGEEESYLDLVALSIIADVVPLLDENRYLLQSGLRKMSNRPGIRALLEVAKLQPGEIGEEDLGFQIVPRLNSAGRIASAALGVELLLSTDYVEAGKLALELDRINQKRRALGDSIFADAQAMLGEESKGRPIVLYRPHWHHGVIGIIAGRLAELYTAPVLLMSLKEDGTTITGSARSVPGVHIFEVLQKCSDFLHKFGGHAGAAGFSLHINQLDLFSKAVEQELKLALNKGEGAKGREYDAEINFNQLNLELYHEISWLGPFGEGNPQPLFFSRDIRVLSRRPISEDKHLRLVLAGCDTTCQAVWWWGGGADVADSVDITYTLNLNRWKGQVNLQLVISSAVQRAELAINEQEPEARDIEIVDLRNWQELGRDLPQFPSCLFYLEGRSIQQGFTKNRYGIDKVDTLVLLSTPPGLHVLKDILFLSSPQKLVLAYGNSEQELYAGFLQKLASIAKSAVAKGQYLEIPALSAASGQLETTIRAGLSLLQAKGFIDVEYITPERVILREGTGHALGDVKNRESRLQLLLAESKAFRRYLLAASPETLAGFIRGQNVISKQVG